MWQSDLMRVLLTGATGYIGSAVAEALKQAGHDVIGLARWEQKATALRTAGYSAVLGDLRDTASLQRATAGVDAIIHTAMDMKAPDAGDVDRAAVKALSNDGKPMIYTSGVWVIGPTFGRTVGELTPLTPPALVAWRPSVEQMVIERGGVVLRPGRVHGRNGGPAADYIRTAREKGVVQFVGKGENHWCWVHVDDLSRAYVAALERCPRREMFLLVDGKPVQVKRLAGAIETAVPGTRIEYLPLDQARQRIGPVADALALDQKIASTKALRFLDWAPKEPGVVASIEVGMY